MAVSSPFSSTICASVVSPFASSGGSVNFGTALDASVTAGPLSVVYSSDMLVSFSVVGVSGAAVSCTEGASSFLGSSVDAALSVGA